LPSSLDNLGHEVTIVQDGSDVGESYGIRLNYIDWLAKYDFD